MKRTNTACLLLSLLTATVLQAQTWVQVWADEFDKNGLPDSSKWMYDVGGSGWGNNELEYYTLKRSENAIVEDGQLIIEARKEAYQSNNYTSARIKTQGMGDWKYGRVEVRAKIPTGRGIWPAIWMLPTEAIYGNWPASGEIDIMENVGFEPNIVHFTIHSEAYNHTIGTQKGVPLTVNRPYDAFHDYVLEWYPDSIVGYFDQTKYFKFAKEAGADYKKWPFDNKFHLLLNIAVGGDWGGANGVDDAIFPQKMLVDYVRVYQMPEGDGPFTITTNATERGTILASPSLPTYAKGSEVMLSATANTDYVFSRWYGTKSGLESSLTLPMYFNYQQNAEFLRQGEMLKNPLFMGGTAFWPSYGANLTAPNDTLKIAIPNATTNPWDIQMSQAGLVLQQGKKYKLRLTAKTLATAGRTISLSVGLAQDPWSTYINNTVSLTSSFKTFEYTLTMAATNQNARVILDLGKLAGDIWVTEISLVDESTLTHVEDAALSDGWTVYPSIVSEHFTVELKSGQSETIQLFNSEGVLVQNIAVKNGKTRTSLQGNPSGTYFVIRQVQGRKSVKKVVKE